MHFLGKQRVSRLRFLLVGFIALGACNDPSKPQTWIKRLRDPEHAAEAVRRLRTMGDPVAVEPLCELFKDYPHANILRAIISFHDRRAIPTLIEALNFPDVDNYHNATKAAHALVGLKAKEAVPALIAVIDRKLPIKSRANLAKQAAIEALAQLGDARAVPKLIEVSGGRPETQDFHLNKVAIRALGQMGDPRAAPALVRALFLSSTVQGSTFPQANVALVRLGPPALPALLKAFAGKDDALNRLGKELSFRPGVVRAKTAMVLGNMRDEAALPDLHRDLEKALAGENLPGIGGVIEALGKMGSDRSLALLLKMLERKEGDPILRVATVHALVGIGNRSALPLLAKTIATGSIAGGLWDLRVESAIAYSELAGAQDVAQGRAAINGLLADDKVKSDPAYEPVRRAFKKSLERLALASSCADDANCYGKHLADPKASSAQKAKAAVMIAILKEGRQTLPQLTAALTEREPYLRHLIFEAIKRIANKGDSLVLKALEAQVRKDSKRRAKYHGADFVSEGQIALAVVARASPS